MLPRRTSHVVSHKRYWEGSHKFGALAHMVLLPSNCLQLCFDTFTTNIFLYGHCNVIYKCPLRYFNTGKKQKKQQISDETQGRLARTEKPLNNFSTPFHGNGWMDCQPLILIVHPLIATKRNMLCDKNWNILIPQEWQVAPCPLLIPAVARFIPRTMLDCWTAGILLCLQPATNAIGESRNKLWCTAATQRRKTTHFLSQKSLASVLPIFLHNP